MRHFPKNDFQHWVRMMVDPGVIAFDNEQADKRGQHDPELGKLLRRHREELTAYLRSRVEK
jgi:hypothetical protein